jgi:hypothetical protein
LGHAGSDGAMTLFEFPLQYREKAAIWRIFEMLPLYGPLAEGHVFRWFAVNIPMHLLTGGKFTSDVDVIVCLRPYPQHRVRRDGDEFIFKTWEVKVSLLDKDGTGRSLKAGKTHSTLKQLNAYRILDPPTFRCSRPISLRLGTIKISLRREFIT